MTAEEIDTEFSHMWTSEKDIHSLVHQNDRCSIAKKDKESGKNLFVIVEVNEMIPYIIDKMLQNNVRIVTSWKDV